MIDFSFCFFIVPFHEFQSVEVYFVLQIAIIQNIEEKRGFASLERFLLITKTVTCNNADESDCKAFHV